jgi:hypothetical protein
MAIFLRAPNTPDRTELKLDVEKVTLNEFKEQAQKAIKTDASLERIISVFYLEDAIDITESDGKSTLSSLGVKNGSYILVRPNNIPLPKRKLKQEPLILVGDSKSGAVPLGVNEENIWSYLAKAKSSELKALLDWTDKNAKKIFEAKGFAKAPKKQIIDLIKRDTLRIKEDVLLSSVINWVKAQNPKADTAEVKKLMVDFTPHIRFPTLSTADLASKVVPLGILESDDILALFSWAAVKDKGGSLPTNLKKWSAVKRKGGLELKYSSDWDDNGLFYYIGTRKGTTSWSNPQSSGEVSITTSQFGGMSGSVDNLVARSGSATWIPSSNYQTNGSWFHIDLRKYEIQPTYYTLRDSNSGGGYQLRNWVLEGSNDGNSWKTLREHVNDSMITSQGMSGRWAIENCDESYRHIRVRVTGTIER